MIQQVIDWASALPHEWAIFLLAMLPITELRAAIPIGITVYGVPVWQAWVLAVLGNMVPTVLILLGLSVLHEWVMRRRILGKALQHALHRAETKFSGKYARYGAIALMLFVAIPLPLTGAWTGSLAAFVFNIPFKRAFPLISVGICLSATIVSCMTLFARGAYGWF